jgi:putative nucleotidyltransferase with HDIG domain
MALEKLGRSEKAAAIASKVGDLPALPQVAARVVQLIHDPKTTANILEEAISRDQAMTARVLRVANSAFYGVRGEIATLSRAIVIMGFNTLRSIVLTGVTEAVQVGARSCFKDRILWEHSVAVALAARTIARECRFDGAEEAYVGGLLHDIGKMVLDANLPSSYQQVLERVYNERQSFVEAENEVFGFDHTDVGALVVKRWGLAPSLCEAVQMHHHPMGSEINPSLCAIVSLADSMCIKLGIGPQRDETLDLSELDATLMLTLDPHRLDEIARTVGERLEAEKTTLRLGQPAIGQ